MATTCPTEYNQTCALRTLNRLGPSVLNFPVVLIVRFDNTCTGMKGLAVTVRNIHMILRPKWSLGQVRLCMINYASHTSRSLNVQSVENIHTTGCYDTIVHNERCIGNYSYRAQRETVRSVLQCRNLRSRRRSSIRW